MTSTAAYAADPVAVVRTAGGALSVRTGPGTTFDRVGTLAPGTRLIIACQAPGQRIRGRVSTSSGWDLLAAGGYVSHAYVAGLPHLRHQRVRQRHLRGYRRRVPGVREPGRLVPRPRPVPAREQPLRASVAGTGRSGRVRDPVATGRVRHRSGLRRQAHRLDGG